MLSSLTGKETNNYNKPGNCILSNIQMLNEYNGGIRSIYNSEVFSLSLFPFLPVSQVSRAPARWSCWPSTTPAGPCLWRAPSLCGSGTSVCTTTCSEQTPYRLRRRWDNSAIICSVSNRKCISVLVMSLWKKHGQHLKDYIHMLLSCE